VPSAFTFGIVFGLNNIKVSGKHKIMIDVQNPEGKSVSTLGPVDVDLDDVNENEVEASNEFDVQPLPDEEVGIIVTSTFGNVYFDSVGYHLIRVFYDEVEVYTHRLYVRYRKPKNMGGKTDD